MAADTERFTSRFKRSDRTERAGGASAGTRDRRRVFEDGGGERDTNPVRVPGSSSGTRETTTTRYSRERGTHDRTESPSTAGKTTTTATLTSKINKLNINDDKDGGGDDENETKPEEEEKKSLKKATGPSANSAKKRQQKKNLRQKRRSTGVVIMPDQPSANADEDEKKTQENTAKNNMDDATPGGGVSSGADSEVMTKQIEQYEKALEDLKDELAKAHKELDTLRNANLRLKDENSALLRVVGSLSGTGHK